MVGGQQVSIGRIIIGVQFEGMTYDDLRAFVRLTKDQPGEGEVGVMFSPDSHTIAGFEDWIETPGGSN